MPHVDPESVTAFDWSEIGNWLHWLWAYFFTIVFLAFTFITAHSIIPSLVATHQLPRKFMKLRPPMYLATAGLIGLAVFLMVKTVDNTHLLEGFWDRWWI